MASREVGGIHVALSAGVARFRRDMKKAEKSLNDFDKRAKKLSKTADKLERAGGKLTRSLTLPLAAAGAAAVKFASDAEESANKFDVVMGESAASVRAELEELTATIPATRAELEEMSAGLQDLLVPMGVARGEAAGMSADMVKLAGDLGSFNNVAPTRVLEAMKSALAGASEPMRRFGVDTREAALDAIALKHGLVEAGEEMDSAARAQAVMIAIQQDSTDAIGDAARTVDEAANSFKFVKRDLKEVGETIGRILLPAARDLALAATRWLNKFDDLDESTQKLIVATAGIAAALGPLSFAIGKAIRGWIALRKAMIAFRAVSLATMGVIGVGAAAGAGLIVGLVKLEEALTKLPPRVKETREEMDKLTESIEGLGEAQILARMVEVTDQLLEANQRFLEARRELQGDVSAGRGFGGLTGARTSAKLEGLEGEMRAAKAEADIFNQTLDKIREALIRLRSASDNAASGVDNMGDAASDAAAETGELSQRMVETTERLEQMRIDRVTKMLEEYSGAMEDASELNTEMADTAGDLVAVNGELVDINRAVRGGTDDAADSTSDLARELERAARTGIDFARTLGLIGDSAAATLNSVANLATGIDDLIGAIGSGGIGGIIGAGTSILGAIGGIVSGLFGGGGPSEEEVAQQRAAERRRQEAERRAEQIRQLNQELNITLALLAQSGEKLQEIANNLGREGMLEPFRKLADALQTPEFDPTQLSEKFKQMLDRMREQMGGLGVDVGRLAGQMGGLGDFMKEMSGPTIGQFKSQMDALGLNFMDVKNLASQFGLQVDELIQVLITGQGETDIAEAQMRALLEAIGLIPDAALEAQRALRAMRDSMRNARDDIERFGVEDPVKQVRLLADALMPLSSEGGPLAALIEQLRTGDLAADPQRFIDQINMLITSLQAPGAQLDLVPEGEEAGLIDQLIGIIQRIREAAEREAKRTAPAAPTRPSPPKPKPAPEPPEVSRPDFIRRAVVTEAQASQILAGNRTRNVRLLQIRDLMQTQNAIIGALPRSIRKNVDVALAEDAGLEEAAA